MNLIKVSVEKEVDTFYEINKDYKEAVRKFIMDGTEQFEIKKFIDWLCE